MVKGLFFFWKMSAKSLPSSFYILFIWHWASLPVLSFISHLLVEKLEFCAFSRSICSTPLFLTFLHPFSAQRITDSWWREGLFIWHVPSNWNNAPFRHSDFLFFTLLGDCLFLLTLLYYTVDDNVFIISDKQNYRSCCSQMTSERVLLLISKDPGRDPFFLKN